MMVIKSPENQQWDSRIKRAFAVWMKADTRKKALSVGITAFALLTVPLTLITLNQRADLQSRASAPTYVPPANHPYLMFNESEVPALQARVTEYPWNMIYTNAQRDCKEAIYKPGEYDGAEGHMKVKAKGDALTKIIGACTLKYVIEKDTNPQASARALDITMTMLSKFSNYAQQMKDAKIGGVNPHQYIADPSFAMFAAILALDTMYNDVNFPAATRALYEGYIDDMAEVYSEKKPGGYNYVYDFDTAVHGAMALWGLYKNDMALYGERSERYWNKFMEVLTADGVFKAGNAYMQARYGGERISKWGYMHIEELAKSQLGATNYKGKFYNGSAQEPKVKDFFEYMFHSGFAPNGKVATFADSNTNKKMPDVTISTLYAAGRFSDKAGEYAAWREKISNEQNPTWIADNISGDILTYVVAQPLTNPTGPRSRIYPDGGAVFWEGKGSKDDLYGFLWNGTSQGANHKNLAHRHVDVNALFLAGYGKALLENSGYTGPKGNATIKDKPANDNCDPITNGGIEWCYDYLHDTAWSSNTVTANGDNHLARGGEGVQEYITSSGEIDYASGLADATLDGTTAAGDSKHFRNFYLIHPQDGLSGYFVSIDEIENIPNSRTDASLPKTVEAAWHPKSCKPVTVQTLNRLYKWEISYRYREDSIDECRTEGNAAEPTYLSIFLATPAQDASNSIDIPDVPIRQGAMAGGGTSIIGDYIRPVYDARNSGSKNIVTLLYPHTNAKNPTFGRFGGSGYTGGLVRHGGGIIDFAAESINMNDITATYQIGDNTINPIFKGKNALYRYNGNSNIFYFVRQGTKFSDGNSSRVGFDATQPVSLFMKGTSGKMAMSQPTQVTFYYPGISGVKVNGNLRTPLSRVSGVSVTIDFTSNNDLRHSIELVLGGSVSDDTDNTATPTFTPSPTKTPIPTNTPTPIATFNKTLTGRVYVDSLPYGVFDSRRDSVRRNAQIVISGPESKTVYTDSTGQYRATMTKPGVYSIRYSNAPREYYLTTVNPVSKSIVATSSNTITQDFTLRRSLNR